MNIEFIKKNWEKVLLGAVLVGLLIAVVSLPIKIAREKTELEEPVESEENPIITAEEEFLVHKITFNYETTKR